MSVELSNKEVKESRRLGKCLDSGMVPVNDLRKFLEGIQRRAEQLAAGSTGKRMAPKHDRKNKYRTKLKVA